MTEQTPRGLGQERARFETFFVDYGNALASGDLQGISACYAVPAFLLSDAAGRLIGSRAEIEADYEGAAEQHRAEGLVAARPTIVAFEPLTSQLVSIDVHWDYLDGQGRSVQQDGYRYIVRFDEDAGPQICTVIVTPHR